MCGPGDKMRIALTFLIFVCFSAKTDLETEVLVREKIETEFKIPQPPNTICYVSSKCTTDSCIWCNGS